MTYRRPSHWNRGLDAQGSLPGQDTSSEGNCTTVGNHIHALCYRLGLPLQQGQPDVEDNNTFLDYPNSRKKIRVSASCKGPKCSPVAAWRCITGKTQIKMKVSPGRQCSLGLWEDSWIVSLHHASIFTLKKCAMHSYVFYKCGNFQSSRHGGWCYYYLPWQSRVVASLIQLLF